MFSLFGDSLYLNMGGAKVKLLTQFHMVFIGSQEPAQLSKVINFAQCGLICGLVNKVRRCSFVLFQLISLRSLFAAISDRLQFIWVDRPPR